MGELVSVNFKLLVTILNTAITMTSSSSPLKFKMVIHVKAPSIAKVFLSYIRKS